jgi:hypothetical protein
MGQVFSPALVDLGTIGAGTSVPDLSKGNYFRLTLSAASRTIAAPVVSATSRVQGQTVDVADPVLAGRSDVEIGTTIYIEVKNASGGATTVTWDAVFKGAPANPATGQRRLHVFVYDGANWVLANNAADVAN